MPDLAPGSIELGLIRLIPGADPATVAARLKSHLPEDVAIYTKQGFVEFEKNTGKLAPLLALSLPLAQRWDLLWDA